jgi:hypothetical protein
MASSMRSLSSPWTARTMRSSCPNEPLGKPNSASGSVDQRICPDAMVPLPRGNLRHFERHAQPFFVLAHAAMGAIEGGGPVLHAPLELLVGELQRRLRVDALGDFALQPIVQIRPWARVLRNSSIKNANLRAQESWR